MHFTRLAVCAATLNPPFLSSPKKFRALEPPATLSKRTDYEYINIPRPSREEKR